MAEDSVSVKNMRILHFEKIIPLKSGENDTDSSEDGVESRKEIVFCTLGYYDRVTYVRAENDIFDNKHSFLIKYPYQKKNQQIIADQMFSIFEKENECESNVPWDSDPFEYAGEECKPFLGIVLVTVYEAGADIGKSVYESKVLVEACKDSIQEIFNTEQYMDNCWKIFYTPNCADLCIVIRTDDLQNITRLKRKISHLQYGKGEDKTGRCHTMTYTMMQQPQEILPIVKNSDFIEKNKEIRFELRISCEEEIADEIRIELQNVDGGLSEITGNGEYAAEMNFSEFMDLYKIIWDLKTREEVEEAGEKPLQNVFLTNYKKLSCTYIRAKYPFELMENSQTDLDRGDMEIAKEYEKKLNSLKEDLKELEPSVKNHIGERIQLVKELTYTYSDFLYKKSSWWKGIVFYIQIDGIIKGIKQYLAMLKEEQDSLSERDKEILTAKLYSDINKSISCVNNFNKLLQSMNQYMINVPNYEMQTKVNVEKYLMAYTMYLFQISSVNSRYSEDKKEEKVLPLLTIDRTEEDIQAYTLFGALDNPREDNYTFFSVLCPNYQWFADIYHVLPMITHEISHNFRFVEREKRNEGVLKFVLSNLTKKFVQDLLKNSIGGYNYFFEERDQFFVRAFAEVFEKRCREELKENISNCKLRVFRNVLIQAFAETAGIEDGENSDLSFWEFVTQEMLQLFDITQIDFYVYEEVEEKNLTIDEVEKLSVNVVLDILCEGTEAAEKWKETIQLVLNEKQDNEKYIKVIEKMLLTYAKDKYVETDYIVLVLGIFIKYFRESLKSDVLDTSGTVVKKCIENLDNWRVEECFNEFSGKMTGDELLCTDEDMRVLEKIYDFCTHYTKLKTGVLSQRDGVLKNKSSKVAETAKQIHEKLHEEYRNRLDLRNTSKSNYQNIWLTFKENQRLFMSLGIINSDRGHFVQEYQKFVKTMSVDDIRERVDALIQLYEEVFADLSMCEALDFSASGYVMYTTHIFMKERTCPSSSTYDRVYDMTLDRLCTVLFTKYEDVYQQELKEAFAQYGDDLKEYNDQEKKSRSLLQHEEMYKWLTRFYSKIMERAETYKNDESIMDLYEHINEVIKEIQKKEWIMKLKKEETLIDIRNYYNSYSYSETKRRKEGGRFLSKQNSFVLEYYAKMKDCIFSIVRKENIKEGNLLEELFKVVLEEGKKND